MLSFSEIPEEYRDPGKEARPGQRYNRFAAGLLDRLTTAHGTRGADAGHRLVASAWHLRYAGVGVEMFRLAPSLSEAFREDDQFIYLSGFQTAVTSAVASIDLGAAALVYLAGHDQREPDLRTVAAQPKLLEALGRAERDWIKTTSAMPEVVQLINIRNARAHRQVPTGVTIPMGGLPSFSIRVEEVEGDIAVDPGAYYNVAVDRFMSLGLLLVDEVAGETS